MARRNPCTKEKVEKARQLKSTGLLDKDIAAIIGVNPATFSKWLNHPKTENQRELGKAIKSAEASWRGALEQRIIKASEGDWKAAAWLLERKDPKHYSLSPARFAETQTEVEEEPDALTKSLMELGAKL